MISFGPLSIPAYIIGSDSNPKKILYLHGYNTSRERQVSICKKISSATNRTVILPEYSGHGNSKTQLGQTTPALHELEAIAVYDWVCQTSTESDICVYGGSYGAYLAAQLCKYRDPGQLILQAPSILYPKDFYTPWLILKNRNTVCKNLPYEELISLRHPLMTRLADSYHGKTTLIEMSEDNVVPHETVSAWRYFLPNANYRTIEGAAHSINNSPESSQKKLIEVIREAIS